MALRELEVLSRVEMVIDTLCWVETECTDDPRDLSPLGRPSTP